MNSSIIIRVAASATLLTILAGCEKRSSDPVPPDVVTVAHDPDLVSLTEKNLAQITITVESVRRGDLEMTFKAVGTVSENLNKTARVTPTLSGRISKLNFDINDQVRKGDELALLETPELLGKSLALKAPIDGIITERKSTVGELASNDTEVYTISDPTDLWVIAEVKERDIAAVHLDEDATFTVLAYPEEAFHGTVVRVGNRVDSASRTLDVRIAVRNEDGRLKPGMFADVEISTTALKDVLLIPDTALLSTEEGLIAFVALSRTKFERRFVKVGLEQRGYAQILEGVNAGEEVVTNGSFILRSEMLKGELGEE